jgi:DNA-binding IclR family transcriptional regulator
MAQRPVAVTDRTIRPAGVQQSTPAVKSADRVLDVFELLGRWDDEMSHTDIAAALSIPKSSLTLLLRNLVGRGYIEYSSGNHGYRLGRAFAHLARQTCRGFDLATCAQPILKNLTAKLGESSALNRLKGQQVEVVATVLSPQRLVSHMWLGDLAPLYATSGGKAILANLSEELQREYLSSVRLKRITAKTIASVSILRRQLEAVRRTGLAYSYEEFTPGIVGVATVVTATAGHPIGAINIAAPAVRANPKMIDLAGRTLQRAAQEMLRQIVKFGGE